MRQWILTHARPAFWLWCLPAGALLFWCAARMETDTVLIVYGLFILWVAAGFFAVNVLLCGWARKPVFRTLDEDCDPEPLLELCRTVLKQNHEALLYRVLEGWSLSLLGREEEARVSARMAAKNPRLWKDPSLLAIWLTTLPAGDPDLERGEQALERLSHRLTPKKRADLERARTMRERAAQVEAAPAELEPLLWADLERAACTREQVAAHLALGCYGIKRGDPAAEEHLSFVMAHGNKLRARVEAERLLCLVPAQKN